MPEFIFTMKDLRKTVPPNREILKGIWLSFYFGAKIGVLGLNGAGKSSLLRIMAGEDADFDGESLLVEAFDGSNELVTTGNLSTLSEEPEDSGLYDLAAGRGPTTISIEQGAGVESADLAHRSAFSGLLARTVVDDEDDEAIASRYAIESRTGTVAVTPENVNGSDLALIGELVAR